MSKKFFILYIISFIFFAHIINISIAQAKTFSSLGFAQSGIWYSADKFLEGDKIKVYSAVFNSSAYELLGAVEFFDNGISIGKSGFYVAGGGKLKEVWVNWTAVKGQHKISAKITEAKIRSTDGQEEAISLENSQTGISDIFVEALPPPPVEEKKDEVTLNQNSISTPVITSSLASLASKSAVFAADSIKYVLKKTDAIAGKGKQIVDDKKEEIKREIKEIPKESTTMERPIKSSYLLALSAASLVLNNKVLFLLFLAAALFILIKFALKVISRNRK